MAGMRAYLVVASGRRDGRDLKETGNMPITDVIGSEYVKANPASVRRMTGSTYTPIPLVEDMVSQAAESIDPDVVVDCGCGSGRFAIACAAAFPDARIVAVDSSREACEMTRINAAKNGFSARISVVEADFMDFSLPEERGRTLWIGNPPYVRHHDIPESSKVRFKELTRNLGVGSSLLAGLHVYFLAQVAKNWRPGDFGIFITSAEWMDVNYGGFVRRLLSDRMGLRSLELFDKEHRVFEDAMTTAVVVSFGERRPTVSCSIHGRMRREVPVERFNGAQKWSSLVSDAGDGLAPVDSSLMPLGDIARVHRGLVTGNNRFWVRSPEMLDGIPNELTTPIVSHAREIMGDCVAQTNPEKLNRLITLPPDLSVLSGTAAKAAKKIIKEARAVGVDKGYVASRRKSWWAVKPPKAPSIMMTYMARRQPVFVINRADLPMLNVVHGIYPRDARTCKELEDLVNYLNKNTEVGNGRTYCGGLTKFEPKEAEAILVPRTFAH